MELDSLYDIYDIWYTPWWKTRFVIGGLMLIISLLMTMVLYGCYRWWCLYQNKKKTAALSLYERAVMIKKQYEAHTMTAVQAYCALGDIAREYLITKYGNAVQAFTQDELIAFLSNSATTDADRLLIPFFTDFDAIKFKEHHSASDAAVGHFDTVIVCVQPLEKGYQKKD